MHALLRPEIGSAFIKCFHNMLPLINSAVGSAICLCFQSHTLQLVQLSLYAFTHALWERFCCHSMLLFLLYTLGLVQISIRLNFVGIEKKSLFTTAFTPRLCLVVRYRLRYVHLELQTVRYKSVFSCHSYIIEEVQLSLQPSRIDLAFISPP
jgi:hypothetical protein